MTEEEVEELKISILELKNKVESLEWRIVKELNYIGGNKADFLDGLKNQNRLLRNELYYTKQVKKIKQFLKTEKEKDE